MDQQTQKKTKAPKGLPKTPEQRHRERRERFTKLAPSRVNKALTALRNVGRCGNQASYSYTPEEAAKIIGALSDAVAEVQDAFAQKSSGKTLFSL